MNIINLSEIRVNEVQERVKQEFIPTTVKFDELLNSVKGNDPETIKAAVLDLFEDFHETVYLLSQFVIIEDLIRPFVDDEFIMKLLNIVREYIGLDTASYASGFELLDKDGRTAVRAINIKQDLLEVYIRLGRFLRNKENKEKFALEFSGVKDMYSKFRAQFESILRKQS